MNWVDILTFGSPIVSGVTMFFLGKRGRVLQVDNSEIQNLKQIIESQREEAIYFKTELIELRAAFNKLQDEFILYKKNHN